ncbi:MAG TPA: glutamyl-tRNA reductase [Bryobacterales bacterium]|nr:glutamyl-tRNA reductase [Bryobacterales bacterium]
MNLLVVGLSHRTAPIEVREQLALAESEMAGALEALVAQPGIAEALIFSTCNRVEFTVRSEPGTDAVAEIYAFLANGCRRPVEKLERYFYRHAQRDAIRHVFRVASSLDSMIVGEPQILGQVKDAYAAAKAAGALGGPLEEIVSRAFHVAKRVRSETGIGQMAVSVSYVAVELARKIFGTLAGHTVLIIGSGKMSELAARHLRRSGAPAVFVANRTHEKALEMAARFEGRAVPFEQLFDFLPLVDIVISSTGSPDFIITRERAQALIGARKNRPMFLIDIAVPRDVDPEVNKIDNMFLYDIDDLQQGADANKREREREAERAEAIVDGEVERMMERLKAHDVAPTIVSLQAELDRIRRAEVERHRAKLGALTPEQEQAIEALTRGIINKIAHTPISHLKTLASHPDGLHFIDAVKRVFNLKE